MSPASFWSLWDFSTKKKEREKERKREGRKKGKREKGEGISFHFVSDVRFDREVEREGKKKKERGVQDRQGCLKVKDLWSTIYQFRKKEIFKLLYI